MSENFDTFGLQCAIISKAPRILFIGVDTGETGYRLFSDGTTSFQRLSDIVGEDGHIIISPWWHVSEDTAWPERLSAVRSASASHGTRFHFFCNSLSEVDYLQTQGFSAILLNQNALAHENDFRVELSEKVFDAIYIAKMTPFKRHYLARDVKSLALIYSKYGELDSYYAHVLSLLPTASFLNGDPSAGTYSAFNSFQIREQINRARVGLCLSKIEGAMYASIEYLLCGIPVVSTHSLGGRDVFFDDRYCNVVSDNEAAIADAVQDIISRNLDPNFIRAETLKKIQVHRNQFIEFIDGLQLAHGSPPTGSSSLERIMSGPWACWTFKTIGGIRELFETKQN